MLGYCDMEQLDPNDIALLLSLLTAEQLLLIIAVVESNAQSEQQ